MRLTGTALALAATTIFIVPLVALGQTSSERIHRIRSGDTLSGIASRYSVSVRSLMSANGFRTASARLKLGSQLTIPEPRASAAVGRRPPVKPEMKPAVARAPVVTPSKRVRRAALIATVPPANLILDIPLFVDEAPIFAWPIDGALSSAFGRRRLGWHRGIDIVAAPGAPIVAAASGLVISSGPEGRYGRVVKIAHDAGFVTVYAHNDQNLVELGDWVAAGQRIATVGRTGRATGEHVHFEIRREGLAYNPLYLLPLPPRVLPAHEADGGEANDDE